MAQDLLAHMSGGEFKSGIGTVDGWIRVANGMGRISGFRDPETENTVESQPSESDGLALPSGNCP